MRTTPDEALGLDGRLLHDAMNAFGAGSGATATRAAAQGTFHRLYDLREPGREPRLLRVAAIAGEASSDLMALECGVMNALRSRGFPVPACEYRALARDGGVRGAHRIDRATGQALTEWDDDEPRMRVALGWVARFLASLHAVRGTGYGPLSLEAWESRRPDAQAAFAGIHAHWDDFVFCRLADHVAACVACGAVDHAEAGAIGRSFDAARDLLRAQPPALLHGDPGSHNFIVDAHGIRAVLDWEDALLGDPLFDLASLCTFQPERRHADVWSAYGVELSPASEASTRFWIYFLRIALAKTVHRARFGYADRPDRAPASRRIQLALARLDEGR